MAQTNKQPCHGCDPNAISDDNAKLCEACASRLSQIDGGFTGEAFMDALLAPIAKHHGHRFDEDDEEFNEP